MNRKKFHIGDVNKQKIKLWNCKIFFVYAWNL